MARTGSLTSYTAFSSSSTFPGPDAGGRRAITRQRSAADNIYSIESANYAINVTLPQGQHGESSGLEMLKPHPDESPRNCRQPYLQ